jgi:hypothetical protein
MIFGLSIYANPLTRDCRCRTLAAVIFARTRPRVVRHARQGCFRHEIRPDGLVRRWWCRPATSSSSVHTRDHPRLPAPTSRSPELHRGSCIGYAEAIRLMIFAQNFAWGEKGR